MARVFMKGCEAIAEAAVRSGCRFYAGYPITPQNEIPEYLARRLPEVGGTFVQGESEVASVNMVYGAAATGTRAMTSSASCGISLKSEGVSFMASARLPAVYCNISRGNSVEHRLHGNGIFALIQPDTAGKRCNFADPDHKFCRFRTFRDHGGFHGNVGFLPVQP